VAEPGAEPRRVVNGSNISLAAGGTVTLRSGGGGGYGDPWEREPALVERDIQYGYVSAERARSDYGCVLDPATGRLDAAATERLRDTRNSSTTAAPDR
jgi:N-methylhydantoinase B